MSFLWDMWENKGEVLEGLLSSFTNPTQEVEKGAPWNREAVGHNIPVDVGQIGTGILEMIQHPVVTADVGLNLLSGAVGKLLPEPVMDVVDWADKKLGFYEQQQENEAMASEAWEGIVATHGGVDELKKYANEHPVLMAWELSGLGLLASQVVKRLSPAVVRAMEDIEARGLLESAINKQTSSVFSGNQGLMDKMTNQFLAHHGNPEGAMYRNFDFDRIGESHGFKEAWGLHASKQKETGVHFAGQMDDVLYNAYDHRLQKHLTPVERDIWSGAKWGELPEDVKARALAKYPDKKAEINTVMKEFEKMHDKSKAQLYELDIHDDALPFMIRKKATLVEQPIFVQDLMRKHGMDITQTGFQFYQKIAEDFATQRGGGRGNRELASKYLASLGIKGMEFMDDVTLPKQKMVNGVMVSEPPLWSYILFDDTSHTMLKRQGKKFEDVPLIDPLYAHRIGDVRAIKGGLLDPDLLGAKIADLPKIKEKVQLKLADFEGYPWVGTQSDLTRASGLLEGVGDTTFQTPVRFRGGQDYMLDQPNVQAGRIWESNEGARNSIINNIIQAQGLKTNKRPILLPYALKPKSMDFSHQVTETMLESVIVNLNKTQKRKLNSLIKKTIKDWKGINSEFPLAGIAPDQRKAIANIIDVNFRHVDGVLSLPESRLINADAMQLNKEPLTLMNVAQTAKNAVGQTSSHPSYGYSVTGEPLGKLVEDISILDLKRFKKESGELMTRENFGIGTGDDLRKVSMSDNYGLLTEAILRTLDDQGKLYGGLLK